MKLTPTRIHSARRHLRAADPVIKAMIDTVGPYTLRFEQDRFAILVRSLVGKPNPRAQEAALAREDRESVHYGRLADAGAYAATTSTFVSSSARAVTL